LGSDGYAKKTRGCILVRAKRPYVQLRAARVTCTKFVVGVTNDRERDELPSLWRLCVYVFGSLPSDPRERPSYNRENGERKVPRKGRRGPEL
jgi:hypothetical protein